MIVLGISESHCSSACLMRDGEIIGMIQEERFTKRKNQVAFPRLAIEEMIASHLGGDSSAIDRVVFAEKLIDPYYIALDRHAEFSVAEHVREQHKLWYPHFYEGGVDMGAYWRKEIESGRFPNKDHNHDLSFLADMDWDAASAHFSDVERPAAMKRFFGWEGETTTLDHHACHAYFALYGQAHPEEMHPDTLVLTADAWGEGRNWAAWTVNGDGTLENIGGGPEHTIARIYKFVTLILGMKPNEHEYKVMGLAPFSRSRRHIEATERVFFEALDFRDGAFVSDRPLKESYFDLRDRLEGHRFDNIAAALQNWTSRVTRAWARHWLKETGKHVLCFSGGLSMNIRLNGELLQMPEVKHMYVPASGGDESICAGACLGTALEKGETVSAMRHVYLGSPAADEDWAGRLDETQMSASDFGVAEGVTAETLARMLADNLIFARCAGPSEFGARALGNRSIIANPSNPENITIINNAIKNRDYWMPFTPSILKEYTDELLDNPKGIDSPFMTVGFPSVEGAKQKIAAALHMADLSARPQFVDRETNPEYWELIDAFRRVTGIPALLNTSLNLHGEPMNYTTADAARTVALSDLDYLVLPGDRLLYKKSSGDVLGKYI